MMSRVRPRSVYDVLALLSFFLVIGGGSALASYVVSSNSQVGPDTISGHKPRTGNQPNIIGGTVNGTDIATAGVVGRNLDSNSVNGPKVADGSLTGADIADRSGVDTCPPTLTVKLGPICAGSDAVARNWDAAMSYCGDLGLRLPSPAEAFALADNYAVPGVTGTQEFWTDDFFISPNGLRATTVYNASGGATNTGLNDTSLTAKTVCVTDPSA
jgi:hypothetical protein